MNRIRIIVAIAFALWSSRINCEIDHRFLSEARFYHPPRHANGSLFPAGYSLGDSSQSGVEFLGNEYRLFFSGECADWQARGTFEIAQGHVILRPISCESYGDSVDCGKVAFGKGICRLEKHSNDALYGSYFVCKPDRGFDIQCGDVRSIEECFKFAVLPSKIPAGVTMQIDRIAAVVLGQMKGIIVRKTKLRNFPSARGRVVGFIRHRKLTPLEQVPVDEPVLLIARTAKLDHLNGSRHYWYYVNIGYNEGVWVYGDSVKPMP